ncbi:unnamed protein product [Effrenium voratum]|uniref:Uncharacterized protein n=1 Tax=Effrenium voratum TaxID=2562239 RepID=A0AA36I0A4_9DINO|nr:unnamed protein product [Effrenium voratum]
MGLQRGVLTRILYPAPEPSYSVDSFPGELVWVPKKSSLDGDAPGFGVDSVPCLLLKYPYSRFLVLFFHSNAEDLGRCYSFCQQLRDKFQVHVLAVEYPGYGVCPGVATGKSVTENALSALHFATQSLSWPLDSIKIFGRSIGTGPAIKLASLFRFAGVILVTPFLSIAELFRDRVGPLSKLVEEWYPNGDLVGKVGSPVLIIHGKSDDMIAYRHAESLFDRISTRKLLVSPPNMAHNTNLMNDLSFLVMPATHFFSLPDYIFQDLRVPSWALRRPSSWALRAPLLDLDELRVKRCLGGAGLGGRFDTNFDCCGPGPALQKAWLGVESCCSKAVVDLHEAQDTSQVGFDVGTLPCGLQGDPLPWHEDPAQPIAVSMPLSGPKAKDYQEEVVCRAPRGREEPRSISM